MTYISLKKIEKAAGVSIKDMPYTLLDELNSDALMESAAVLEAVIYDESYPYKLSHTFVAAWVFYHLNRMIDCSNALIILLDNVNRLTLPQLQWVGGVNERVTSLANHLLSIPADMREAEYNKALAKRPLIIEGPNRHVAFLTNSRQLRSGMYGFFKYTEQDQANPHPVTVRQKLR